MKNDLQKILFNIITTKDYDHKISLSRHFSNSKIKPLEPLHHSLWEKLKTPGRPNGFKVVPPRNVPKRDFHDLDNRIHFLHAIANIELLAIELPALCLLRYGNKDAKYIKIQIDIISEEANHFSLLRNRLEDFGCQFGTLSVHHGLWDYAWRCQSELEHQILIPCYLEARGLDVSPGFVKKFEDIGDTKTANIMRLILKEEVEHVRQGNEYIQRQSKALNTTPDILFKKILTHFIGNKIKSKCTVNEYYRKQAGFSETQIQLIKTGI